MGCTTSSPAAADEAATAKENAVRFGNPPPWKSEKPMTQADLDKKREEFWGTWGTAVYGGEKEIWAALKVAAESDIETARTIVESAGIIVSGRDLSRCWDERGALYNLPNYVLSSPTNLVKAEW